MTAIRYILRFAVFLIALVAIVAIVGAGVIWYRNDTAGNEITVAQGGPSVGRAPEDAEDLAIYVLLQARAEEINIVVFRCSILNMPYPDC